MLIILNVDYFAQTNDSLDNDKFTYRSTILSSIVPGCGQINNNKIKPINLHNRLWWKLPIIYGGLGTATYLIKFNHQEFITIKNERLIDRMVI
jgi:hypothetical protein